jgi:hypothetical protein
MSASNSPEMASEAIPEVEALSDKRLIFCLTSGRSGTQFLTDLLTLLKNASVNHEAKPAFHDVMREVQTDAQVATAFLLESKLPQIASQPEPTYVEISHVFCKGFVEPLLDLGIVPDVIVLSRPHRQVAKSMHQLGTIPGRSSVADEFYLRPDDPDVLRLPGWEKLDDYQLCYWYCLEIERRQHLYAEMLEKRGASVVSFQLSELTTLKGFIRLFRFATGGLPSLGCFWWYLRYRRRKVNTKPENKALNTSAVLPADLAGLENEVRTLVGMGTGPTTT